MPNRIDTGLQAAKAAGNAALAPFVTVGFPDVETSLSVAAAVLEAGADLLELGVPFSDPLAEGLTIQKTSHRALQQGVTVRSCLDVARRLRERGVDAPIVLMGYYNPYVRYGLADFVRDASAAGVDGLIVPDLPTEEAGTLKDLLEGRDMYLVPLLAPTSTDERIAQACCKHAKGFIYCVSVTGVTGAREQLRSGIADLVGRIRRHTGLPVLVGFGVSTREHFVAISRFADGAVVGSALMDAVDESPREDVAQTARDFVMRLKPPRKA